MTKSTITDERITSVIERLEHFASNLKWTDVRGAQDLLTAADGLRELQERRKAAMDSEPVIADCDPEVYEKGVSACLVVIPKETAEVICKGISAATGCKVDWHYIGGRVHIKALQAALQPAPVVPDDVSGPLAHAYKELTPTFMRNHIDVFERYGIAPNDSSTVIQALRIALDGIERRAAMLQAEPVTTANKLGNSPVIPDTWIPVSERMPETDGNYWGWWSESKRQGPVWFIKSELQAQFQSSEVTHWMPLPAAPQEVKGE